MGRSLFPVNLKSGMSVFLLVISVNHTHTRFKVSFKRILLTRKSALANREYTTQGLAPFPPISLSYHQWVGCGGPLQGLFPVCQRRHDTGSPSSVTHGIPYELPWCIRWRSPSPIYPQTIHNIWVSCVETFFLSWKDKKIHGMRSTPILLDMTWLPRWSIDCGFGIILAVTSYQVIFNTFTISCHEVNCVKTLELLKCYIFNAIHLRSSNVFTQLTHSMLPLSLLILGCYTCSINRFQSVIDGTSVATYEDSLHNMSRDNGSKIRNIECHSATSHHHLKPDGYGVISHLASCSSLIRQSRNELWTTSQMTDNTGDTTEVAEDLYSHQYGYETIKTISNTAPIRSKNIIIPLINGTGTRLFPVMIIFCIRDSLREYKSNYVILSTMKLALYNWFILSESAIFNLLFWSSYQHILSPLYITINLSIVFIQLNSNDLSLKNTNLLSNSAIIFGYHYIIGTWLGLIQWYLCSYIFMEGQLNEFTNLAINMNDTLLGCVLYNIDGWHLYHIVVGNILLITAFNLSSWSQYIMYKVVLQLRVRLHHMFYNMQLVYWHFVELLWLGIYYVLYS